MPQREGRINEARRQKMREVDEFAELLSKSNLLVVTDYRGLTVAEMAALRRKLRDHGVEYHVTKNTLMGFAADKSGKPELKGALVGPTAVAFVTGDEAVAAKVLSDYERGSKVFKIKGALLGRRALDPVQVGDLGNLPPRPVLLSQMVAGFQAPIVGVVGVLSGLLGGLVGTLEARRQQLEQQGAAS
ncbi:MAG: 50S ribosomal protein L10 [Sphingomonadaceae bacterium]